MFDNVITMIKDAISAASAWLTAVFTSCGNEFFAIFISAFFIYSVYRLLLFPMLGAGFSDNAIVPSAKRKSREAANEKKFRARVDYMNSKRKG